MRVITLEEHYRSRRSGEWPSAPSEVANELERAVRGLGFKGTMIQGVTQGVMIPFQLAPSNF